MARPKKKYHYIYKTTCNLNGRYYIGIHSALDLEDGYMGSGKRLRYSIRKYGVENHTKEILEFLEDRESLIKREAEIVNESLINDPLCMNLKCGGGAVDSKVFHGHDQVTKDKISKSLSKPYDQIYGTNANLQKNKRKVGAKKQWEAYTDEQRKVKLLKISEKVKEHWANNEYKVKSYICPHCNKEGKGNVMLRHHFDKCKKL